MALTTLAPLLTRLSARYRLSDGLWRFTRTAWLAPLAAVALLAAARSRPIAEDHLWALGLAVALLLLLALLAWRRPVGLFEAARRADRALGLKDRLATAWVLEVEADRGARTTAGSGDALPLPSTPSTPPHDLVARQRMDALAAARDVDPRRVVPLHWSRRPLGALALLSVGAVALALLPNPQHAELARRAAVRVAARQLAEEVRRREEAVADAETLSAEAREQAGAALRELRAALDGSQGRADADLAALAEAETALRSGLDREALRRAAGARSLAERLEALSREARQPSSEAAAATPSANAKEGSAGEALTRLAAAAADTDQASRDSLARALRDEAQAVGRDQPAAATQLAALADALSRGDQAAAGRAAEALADSLDRAQAAAAGARTVEDALGALEAGRTVLVQANAAGQPAASPAAGDAGTVADAGGAQGQPGQGQEAGTPGAAADGQQAGARTGSDSQAGTANGSAEGAGQGEAGRAGQPGEAGSDAAGQGAGSGQGTGADAGQGPGQEGQGTGEGQAAGGATTAAAGESAGGGDSGGSNASGFGRSGQAGASDGATIEGGAGDRSRPGGAPSTTAPGAAGLVYAPPRRLGPLGERSFVPGSIADDQDTGIPSERPARQPGLTSASRVPYREVFPAYREAAGRALQRETIPLARRDYVRAYFAQLGE